jgi:ABC-type polysaccharide/polyol phosphate export permease
MNFLDKKYLNLLREIVVTQFKLKDQSTFFGFMWSFLNPLVMLLVLLIFFRLRIGDQVEHYGIYLLIGIIHYTHFANTTNASMNILSRMRQLTCNAVFPKELLVVGSVISNTIEFGISMLICLPIAYFSGVRLFWSIGLLPLVFLLQIMMVLWVSFILASVYVFVRDIGHIYQVFLRVLFFTTPIFYTAAFFGAGIAKYVVLLNPLAHLITFSRNLIIDGNVFSVKLFALFLLANALCTYAGFKLFKKCEPKFAEYA